MFWVQDKFGNKLDNPNGSVRLDDSVGPGNPNGLGSRDNHKCKHLQESYVNDYIQIIESS